MIDIKHTVHDTVDLVTVKGNLNRETAPLLNQALRALVDQGRYRILLNLSEVSLMTSAGLRVLVAILKATRPRGGDLQLLNPSERALETLKFAGLIAVFKVVNSESLGLEGFQRLPDTNQTKP